MNKIVETLQLVIAVLISLSVIMLTSCGSESVENGKTEIELPQSTSSEIETTLTEGAELVGTLGREDIYAEELGKEVRPKRFFDSDGKPYIEDKKISIYKFLDSKGRYITEYPVEEYLFIE